MRKQVKLILLSSLIFSLDTFAAAMEDNLANGAAPPQKVSMVPEAAMTPEFRLHLYTTAKTPLQWAPNLTEFLRKKSGFQPKSALEKSVFDELIDTAVTAIIQVFQAYDDPEAHVDEFFYDAAFTKCMKGLSLSGKIRSVRKTLETFNASLPKTHTKTYVLNVCAGTDEVSWNSSGSA